LLLLVLGAAVSKVVRSVRAVQAAEVLEGM
jgi:hypothetical protein